MGQIVILNGVSLTAEAVVAIARDGARVGLEERAREALTATRQYIEEHWLGVDAPLMYAFNTGVGALKSQRIAPGDIEAFQTNLVRSHSAGAGDAMPTEVVRAMMALRVNAFASNHSGVRVEILDRLIAMLNHGITPVVAAKGSVGASGDLAPLALMSGAMMGLPHSRVRFDGQEMPAARAFERCDLPPTIDVQAKDATALINGATASLAYAVLAAFDARSLLTDAMISAAMTIEALRGEVSSFDARVMRARPHAGQARTAFALRQMLSGSQRCSEPARQVRLTGAQGPAGQRHSPPLAPRIQDAYSLRCIPQVHGPVLDALDYVDAIVATEINSATDNPLIFPEEEGYAIVSGGHFHGQYIAQAMDFLALAVTDLSAICDRRSARLIDPSCNFELPGNLIAQRPGINSGFAVAQSMGTGLVLENMGLCSPASATSLPAKGNTEDHISNSCFAARRTRTIVDNARSVIAVETLLAAQALDLCERDLADFPLGIGTSASWRALRETVPAMLGDDRWMHDDIAQVTALLADGTLRKRVGVSCGPLWPARDSW
ncbi:histidine ammonia-lyase [Mitsuaria sp. 7]|uniref:HAL/PAL/TAL family ammonia-lyase n=1 Tax=Mitsuaria sp. 7 TaxID=1658665 RepID=UPI0007DD40DA|nr:aromatic amino acid ammonia-lyase [Mitsuaria sp. 7]ANH67454.1 histidine ammonia-lyase [Mitsuaria sp. 7]